MFNFEKLEVWHAAIEFADQVYTRVACETQSMMLSGLRRSLLDSKT